MGNKSVKLVMNDIFHEQMEDIPEEWIPALQQIQTKFSADAKALVNMIEHTARKTNAGYTKSLKIRLRGTDLDPLPAVIKNCPRKYAGKKGFELILYYVDKVIERTHGVEHIKVTRDNFLVTIEVLDNSLAKLNWTLRRK